MATSKSLFRHYDVTRDDVFFLSLLGQYDDETPPLLPWNRVPNLSSSPAVLSEMACLPETIENFPTAAHCNGDPTTSSTFFTNMLNEHCEKIYGSKPHYTLLSQKLGPKDGTILFESSVSFPSNQYVFATGTGQSKRDSYEAAAKKGWTIAKGELLSPHEYADLTRQFTMSFRTAASRLPFALRFQLERALFAQTDQQQLLSTKSRCRDTANAIAIAARKMILVFVQIVLPPLLELNLKGTTLSELFADEIWPSLERIQNAVRKGDDFLFWEQAVEEASLRAGKCLSQAEKVCGMTESDLDIQSYDFSVIQKRAMWPIGEYRCQIRASAWPVEETSDGTLKQVEIFDETQTKLIPISLEIVNKNRLVDSFVPPCTRRAQREMGWSVRDRFVLISSLKFHPSYNSEIVDWLRAEPELCGRRYAYLFDKGTGRPNVWLYSQPNSEESPLYSRENFLVSLGCFDNVTPTKLGDRIGLAFTQTIPIMHLSIDRILPVPEIVHNGYIFSDGCGVFGVEVAEKTREAFHLGSIPGAIQIRMGGVKGMLSLKTDFPPDCIGLRKSMVKFASDHMVLEVKAVANTTEQQDYNLFNQILLIMGSQMPRRVFLELQTMACAKMAAEYDKTALEKVVNGRDVADAYSYVRKVIRYGKKLNGEKFGEEELVSIKKAMTEAKRRANLPRIKATLMFAVIDEHNFLAEGEVLIGNGEIQGPVLLCRSPCNFMGDIQRAYAIPGRKKEPFVHLRNILVFSANGNRPIADMLAGGDLDGDQFFVIYDERLVGMFQPREPFDFGSQRKEPIPRQIDVQSYFSYRLGASPPDIEVQFEVFKNYMRLGNIVSQSSDAWLCVADAKGPDDKEAVRMAEVCQRALDARKLSCDFGSEVNYAIDEMLRRFKLPDWKGGPRKSHSVIGIMIQNWQKWIDEIEQMLNQQKGSRVDTSKLESEPSVLVDDETVASVESQVCVVCLSRDADQKCQLCDYVWYCSSYCRRIHDNLLGHNCQPQLVREDAHSILDMLIEVTFRRKHLGISSEDAIRFDSLSDDELRKLANMACIEFLRSLSDEVMKVKESNMKINNDSTPHAFDVVLLKSKIYKQGGELAICLPVGTTGALIMVDKAGNTCPVKDAPPGCRVASLSGTVRILECLMRDPEPGSLMHFAMNREKIMDIGKAEYAPLPPSIANGLNERQRKAVSAIIGPSFKSGFVALLGPPGTGKTHTITAILNAMEQGVIVTAPSNAAISNLVQSLMKADQFDIKDIVVYGENCDSSVEFLNPSIRRKKYVGFRRSYDECRDEQEKEKKLRDFAAKLFRRHDNITMKEIESYCEFDGEGSPCLTSLASARFVFCTLNTAGSARLRKAITKRQCFDLLVLDEAAQCTEAEFYIAATFPGVKRVVLVGDPKQLSSTVLDQQVKEAGYGESFLSHLYEFRREYVWLLNVQYRSHPQIIQFSNEMFYDSVLKTGRNVLDRVPAVDKPVQFIDLSEMSEEVRSGTSYQNEYEAAAIKHWLDNDQDILRLVEAESESIRVIIISPYLAQVNLLKKRYLKKYQKNNVQMDVATVDSFQGQEGDIVILSTVRTSPAKFLSDDRINVAMTRAKRILRVFGDLNSFARSSNSLVLQKLARFAKERSLQMNSEIDAAWRRPDWTVVTNFKPTMTARFHHSLHGMTKIDRNVAFNTLQTVAKPDLKQLSRFPNQSQSPRWFLSSLKGHSSGVQIVWVAKENKSMIGQDYAGIVEGHFAGSREECLHFTQINVQVPKFACRVKCDVQRGSLYIVPPGEEEIIAAPQSTELALSWLVTNELQAAVLDTDLPELPEGLFLLDPDQEAIIAQAPPLLLESRSGTGKTNCLFYHALSYAQAKMMGVPRVQIPICFVTVSSNLERELKKKYDDANAVAKRKLWPVVFFSFRELLDYLLDKAHIRELKTSETYSFLEYVYRDRTSKKGTMEDIILIENEIGGVIMGSLTAALSGAPLTRAQYLDEKRSNVPNDTEEGQNIRMRIYDEYEHYMAAKMGTGKYDINDTVLRLIGTIGDRSNGLAGNFFQSAYIDEVQDFSYAALYLILSISGSLEGNWAAAGDTAQMITPGCSYTFDGMKQTMLAVNSQVKMQKVRHLTRNYRMSKDVLDVGNAILGLLKTRYPHAIEYAPPEIAMKDLGFRVVLLDFGKAKQYTNETAEVQAKKKLSFGTKQAVIIASPHDPEEAKISMREWIGDHPFILSSLDSKGLEFEDIMVHAFQYRHKAWNVGRDNFDGLRLLRELYVAVTRARRRVVILTDKVKGMDKFFTHLDVDPGLEWIDPSVILNEFEKETTPDMWFERGLELFNNEKYELSHSCFNAANEFGWASRAQGRHFYRTARSPQAKTLYRKATSIFYENSDFRNCLDAMNDLAEIPPWDEKDDEILNKALLEEPNYLPRPSTVKFSLLRGAWSTITVEDLIDGSTCDLFRDYRQTNQLRELVKKCTAQELQSIQRKLPVVAGDYYLDYKRFPDAIRLYLGAHEISSAFKATESALKNETAEVIFRIIEYWRLSGDWGHELSRDEGKKMNLLLSLVDSPREASLNAASECIKYFGMDIVRHAVSEHDECGCEELFRFDREGFRDDILQELSTRYATNLVDLVSWYLDRGESTQAAAFAWNNVNSWSDDHLLTAPVLRVMKKKATSLVCELEKRLLLVESLKVFLSSDAWDLSMAEMVSNEALKTIESSKKYVDELFASWNARRNDTRVKSWIRKSVSTAKIRLFLCLFDDPQQTADSHGKLCYSYFGGTIVSKAVNRKKPFKGHHVDLILRKFDVSLAPQPKQAPRQSETPRQSQRPHVESNSDSSADSESDIPPLQGGDSSSDSDEKLPPLWNGTPGQFAIGDRVIIQQLQSKREYNGCHGTIRSRLVDTGRFCVRLDGEKKDLSVRPQCLIPESANSQAGNERGSNKSSSDVSDDDDDDDDDIPILETRGQYVDSSSSSSSSDGVYPVRRRGQYFDGDTSSSDDSVCPGLVIREDSDEDSSKADQSSASSDDVPSAIPQRVNRVRPTRQQPRGRGKRRGRRK